MVRGWRLAGRGAGVIWVKSCFFFVVVWGGSEEVRVGERDIVWFRFG